MKQPKLIVILGPTASGKTAVSLQIAREIGAEIIAADSRTIYRGMNIGTAKPEGERVAAAVLTPELVEARGIHGAKNALSIQSMMAEKPYVVEGVPHWGIDIVDPDDAFTVADFKQYAEEKIADIVQCGKIPMLVGGTGLYIEALVDNYTFREDEQEGTKGPKKYDVLLIGMQVDREELYDRIEARVDAMIAGGLVDEVRQLKEQYGRDVNAMTGIGYRQICDFLDGYMKLKDAIEVIKRATRNYAKRQMTWFRRDARIQWMRTLPEVQAAVRAFLASP